MIPELNANDIHELIGLTILVFSYLYFARYHYKLVREKLNLKLTIVSSLAWLSWTKTYLGFGFLFVASVTNGTGQDVFELLMLGFFTTTIPFAIAFCLIGLWHGYTSMIVYSPLFANPLGWIFLSIYLPFMILVKIMQTFNYITSDNEAEVIFDDDYEMQWDGTYAKKDEPDDDDSERGKLYRGD